MKTTTALFLALSFLGSVHLTQANPNISVQPASRTNNVGDNAQFTVAATGTGTLHYQWKFNTFDIGTGTAATLNVPATNISAAGTYSVVVTDDVGPTPSSGAVLYLPFGSRKILTQWNFNSTSPDGTLTTGANTPSIGAGTFALVSVSSQTFRAGSPSDPASLGTDNSGRNMFGPNSGTANKTGGAQFTGVSTIGYKNIAVSLELYTVVGASAYWRGQYTTNGTDWVDRVVFNKRAAYVQLGTTAYTYFYDDLSDVPEAKNCAAFGYRVFGEYESTATGSGSAGYVSTDGIAAYDGTGSATRWDMATFLGVLDNNEVQPVVVTSPQSQTVVVGDDVTFNVSATGGNLFYYWKKESVVVSSGTSSSYTLPNVQLASGGNYSVLVSNSVNTAPSDTAVLTVLPSLAAGDRFWSADGTTGGGSGSWDTTTSGRWGLADTGPFDMKWRNTNADNAVFIATGAAPGTITVVSPITVNRITITNASASATYGFSGGSTLTLTNNAEIYISGSNSGSDINSVTVNCLMSGPVVTKTGGGRLSISNTGNTVGRYVVSGGIVGATTGSQFGVAPADVLTNYFTIDDGAGIGFAGLTTASISATKGIYLRGSGKIGVAGTASAPTTLTLSSPITGPGGLSFPDFGNFPNQLSGAGGKFILNNAANDWRGMTTVQVGELRVGVAGSLPTNTSITLNGASGANVRGRLNVNGFNVAVQNVIVSGSGAMIFDSVGTGSVTATNYDIQQSYTATNALSAVLAGNASLTKTTVGIAGLWGANTYTGDTFLMEGTINLNGIGRFGNGAGTLYLIGTNGLGSATVNITLTETRTNDTILLNPVVMTAAEVQIQSGGAPTGELVYLSGGSWTVGPGTLYLVNGSSDPSSSFTLALTNTAYFDPASQVATYSDTVRLSSLNPVGSDQTFDGVISGPGNYLRSVLSGAGGRTIFTAANSYSGGTVIDAGTLLVNNTFGSGTGSGAVSVTAPGGMLGGTGIISGPVTVTLGGTIAAGASAGLLTLQNGLDLSGGGTNVWELAALKDDSNGVAGSDFDQLLLTGGELVLGGSSQLVLQFGIGQVPNSTVPFWQSTRHWTIVALSGGMNSAGAAFASIANPSYNAGSFSTSVGVGGNIVLTFTPSAPASPHVTTDPISRTNVVGTTASFTVAATGSDTLTYAWFRNDAPFTPIGGATNATYTITNVQFAQANDYFARVSNGLGNDTSHTAKLTVVARPQMQPPAGAGTANVTLTWPSVPNTSYQVRYNTNLGTANWYVLTNVIGTSSTLSVIDHPPVNGPMRFYRLLIQ